MKFYCARAKEKIVPYMWVAIGAVPCWVVNILETDCTYSSEAGATQCTPLRQPMLEVIPHYDLRQAEIPGLECSNDKILMDRPECAKVWSDEVVPIRPMKQQLRPLERPVQLCIFI